jgi:hypothetical protein
MYPVWFPWPCELPKETASPSAVIRRGRVIPGIRCECVSQILPGEVDRHFETAFESRLVGRAGRGAWTDGEAKTGGEPRHREVSGDQIHRHKPPRCGNH